MHKFFLEYDRILRKGFEDLIESKLQDKWCHVAGLSRMYGGMVLKPGLVTSGAQHLTSLVSSKEGIKKFLRSWDLEKVL